MKKVKTNLGKRVHMYSSLQECEQQFVHDVTLMGMAITDLFDKHFDYYNPWDQTILMAILTNILAYVEVHAELDGMNCEEAIRETYQQYLEEYRQQAKENQHKIKH